MTTKQPDFSDINALAIEACDMWQEHLSSLANDPAARAQLTRFLEPQRRMFADWAAMMQQGGGYGPSSAQAGTDNPGQPDAADESAAQQQAPSATPGESTAGAAVSSAAPPGHAAHGDDPLRVAQLALRLAELEKRVAELESRAARAARGA